MGDKKFRLDFITYSPGNADIFWYLEHVGMQTDSENMMRWERNLIMQSME